MGSKASERTTDCSVRHGNIEVGGSSKPCRDPWHNLIADTSFTEYVHLLSSVSEDKGIAALETYDLAHPFRSQLDEQCIDLGLLHRMRAIALPYIVEAGSRGDELDNAGRDESVIDDDLR